MKWLYPAFCVSSDFVLSDESYHQACLLCCRLLNRGTRNAMQYSCSSLTRITQAYETWAECQDTASDLTQQLDKIILIEQRIPYLII